MPFFRLFISRTNTYNIKGISVQILLLNSAAWDLNEMISPSVIGTDKTLHWKDTKTSCSSISFTLILIL